MPLLRLVPKPETILDLIPPEALSIALRHHQLSLYEYWNDEDGWELSHFTALEDLAAYAIGVYGSGSEVGREALKLLDLVKEVRILR